jgi:M6 family metalloprotease-like protein
MLLQAQTSYFIRDDQVDHETAVLKQVLHQNRESGFLQSSPNVLVILMDFEDAPHDIEAADVDGLFNVRTIESHPESGGFRDYLDKNSYGQFNPNCVMAGWYRSKYSYEYHLNTHGSFAAADSLYFEGLEHVLADENIDLSLFDNDQDGRAEGIMVITSKVIRTQAFFGKFVMHEGIEFGSYAMSFICQDDLNLGTTLHEYGHTLGLPDLYLTKEPVGDYCIMSHAKGLIPGNFCAWAKIQLGWMSPTVVEDPVLGVEIPESNSNPFALKVYSDIYRDGRYFLIENRVQEGYDEPYERRGKIEGEGLVIYHVDESFDNEYVRVIQADGRDDLRTWNASGGQMGNTGDPGDFFPGSENVRMIDGSSNPNTKSFFGEDNGISIRNISDPAPVMTADISPILTIGGTLRINPGLVNIFRSGFSWLPLRPVENDSVWAGDTYDANGFARIDGFTYNYSGTYTYPDDIYTAQKVNLKLYRHFDMSTSQPSDLFYENRFDVTLPEIDNRGTFSTTARAMIWLDEPLEIPPTFFATYCPINHVDDPGKDNRIVRGLTFDSDLPGDYGSYLSLGSDYPSFEKMTGSHWTLHFYVSGEGVATSSQPLNVPKSIGVYPNPAHDLLYLKEQAHEKTDLRIINSLGQLVTGPIEIGGHIDINFLDNGVYIFIFKVGDSTYVERVVVAK